MMNWIENRLNWLREVLTGSQHAYNVLVGIYRDALLDNVLQPCKNDEETAKKVESLKALINSPEGHKLPLGELFSIEAQLWIHYREDTVKARFWSVRDRFERVTTAETRTRYAQTVPAADDAKWSDAEFIRSQALSLIDTIQNNQLISIHREDFTNKLRRTVFALGVIILTTLIVIFKAISAYDQHSLILYYCILFFMGSLGACVSYVRRLQAAVDHNALQGDGLAEFYTIANNRITALSTIMVGGVFAVVLYWLVLSSAFAALIPSGNAQPGLSTANVMAETLLSGRRAELASMQRQLEAATTAVPPNQALQGELKAQISEKAAAIANLENESARTRGELTSFIPAATAIDNCQTSTDGSKATQSAVPENAACMESFGKESATVMGLADARSFYLMLVLAFLSGFAETLVPDALDRLGKRLKQSS